jgi:rhamnulokinase
MIDTYLAVDLGAESGRVIALQLDDDTLAVHEIHRFANQPIQLPSGLHWDVLGLWREIVNGLGKSAEWAKANSSRIVSIGVDAWGVDWALIGQHGELVGLPHAYRDPRNPAACAEALQIVSFEEIYRITGIQFMPINTIFSLFAQRKFSPDLLDASEQLVFIPDLFHYWLSGRVAIEATIASTSQLIDIGKGNWSDELITRLGFPPRVFGAIQLPASVLGNIRSELARATGLNPDVQIILPPSHDTASAVAAVPATGDSSWCYLSSGTWSLLGAEIDKPCTTVAAQQAMFTNELGVGGRIRFLKNIAGLWLVQELRRDMRQRGQEVDYAELTRLAGAAAPFGPVIDTTDASLQTPGGIIDKIVSLCRNNERRLPASPGELARCCLESLALAYRQTFQKLCQVLSRDFEIVHIVGGGGQNQLLSQMTADVLERTVIAGPAEATAIGNGLSQAMALGQIGNLDELRALVARSVSLTTYRPAGDKRWKEFGSALIPR